MRTPGQLVRSWRASRSVSRRRVARRTATVALGLAAAAAGCGERAGGNPAPERPPAGPVSVETAYSIALPGEPAGSYETGSTDGGSLVDLVSRRFPTLLSSSCLQRAARAHLELPLGDEQRVPLAFTEFALHWAGCPDPTATLSVLLTSETGPEPLLDELAEVVAGETYSHIAIASSRAPPPYAVRWFALLVDRRIEMAPVPTSVQAGDSVVLQLELDDGFDGATVVVTTPRGTTETFEAGVSDSWVVATVETARETGRQWVEVIGHATDGPRVLALFPIEVGRDPPRRWVGTPAPDESWVDTTEEAESLAARLVRQDRARFGLPELVWDPRLAEIARAHSREMADEGTFAHVSPRTGSVADRLAAAGYPASFVAENIAMAPSLAEAQESLMRSPGHRAAILSPEPTHLGIGVVSRDEEGRGAVRYLTQIFARR